MKKYRTLLKNLNASEPFTKKEENTFTKQERTFIRDIQMTYSLNKEKGIDEYMDYVHKSKKQRRKIRNEIGSYIESMYPKHKRTGTKIKTKEYRERKVYSQKETFEDWNIRMRNERKARSPYYQRILKGHTRYPTKTLKELRGH